MMYDARRTTSCTMCPRLLLFNVLFTFFIFFLFFFFSVRPPLPQPPSPSCTTPANALVTAEGSCCRNSRCERVCVCACVCCMCLRVFAACLNALIVRLFRKSRGAELLLLRRGQGGVCSCYRWVCCDVRRVTFDVRRVTCDV